MRVADSFRQITKCKYLYNIMPLNNIPSIIQKGILSYNLAEKVLHSSVALSEVQQRRSKVTIPGGLRLHDYANLYFTYHNPMLYRRQDKADYLCILVISADVLDMEDCIVSDRNAATDLARFYSAKEGINKLDFNKIYAQYWTSCDAFEQNNLKAIKCAEVLVPRQIPFDYILGAIVVSNQASDALQAMGFDRKILVKPTAFYR